MSARLAVETLAARAAGRLSRLAGAGGGTTLPGKLIWKLDPGAIDALAARLPHGAAVVSATNGKTTTTAMAAEILGDRHRLAWNRSGANLVSGVASTLLAARDAELGLLEVDEAALPEVLRRVRPRAVLLGNLFRDQLDRYGELEHIAERWRAAAAAAAGRDDSSSSTATTLRSARSPPIGSERSSSGSTTRPTPVPRCSTQRTRATASAAATRTSSPPRTSATSATTAAPRADMDDPRSQVTARAIELDGLDGVSFELDSPAGSTRIRLPLPGLYNVYNALGAAALAQALGASLAEIRDGLERFGAAFGRFERVPAGDKTILLLLIKNPAGANEVVHTLEQGGLPPVLVVALNDAIADGKDVSWIWDVDFEPLLARHRAADRLGRPSRRARPPLRLRRPRRGRPRAGARSRAGARPRPGADPARRRARRPPHLHRDARAPARRRRPRAGAALVGARMRIRVGHLYPGVPEHLRRSRQHRRARAPSRAARARARRRRPSRSGTTSVPGEHDLLYVGGGQDREQALVAPDLAAKGPGIHGAVEGGAALLAVCGGYQLLGRGYLGRHGDALPGVGLFPHETVAGERRMIGDVLLECELEPGERHTLAGFENHAGRTRLDAGCGAARPRRRRVRQRRRVGVRGVPGRARDRHLPARAAPAAQPVARRLAAEPGARPRDRRRAARRSSLCPTGSRPRRTRCRRGGRGTAAAASRATAAPRSRAKLVRSAVEVPISTRRP